jgi:Cupin superfamily protein
MPIATFEELLAPFAAERFVAEVQGRNYCFVPGNLEKSMGIFSWQALNEVMETGGKGSPRLQLIQNGVTVPQSSYTTAGYGSRGWDSTQRGRLKAASIMHMVRTGATLTIRAIDELVHPVRALAEAIEGVLGCRVQVNVYAAATDIPCFDPHYDDHDVIILQLDGTKNWSVFPPTVRFPLKGATAKSATPPSECVWSGTLRAGDVLYIPRGWWHAVRGTGVPTLHLTVGTFAVTTAEIVASALGRLQSLEIYRKDVPGFCEVSARLEWISSLRKAVLDCFDDDAINHVIEEQRNEWPRRPRFGFPVTNAGEGQVSGGEDSTPGEIREG